MNAYSEDLRRKIVEAVKRGMPKIEAARTFGVGISSVKRYMATYHEGGSLAPKKQRSAPAPNRSSTKARGSFWRRTSRSTRRRPCPRGASSCGAYVEFRSATPRFPGCSGAWVGAEKKIGGCERERRVAEGSLAGSGGQGSGGRAAAGVRGGDGRQHLAGTPVCLVETGRTGTCERTTQLGSERHLAGEHYGGGDGRVPSARRLDHEGGLRSLPGADADPFAWAG